MRGFAIVVLGACWVNKPTPTSTTSPPHDEPLNTATMSVAGCNAGCTDCGLGDYKSFVVGTLARTGARVFPIEPLQPGYSCAARVHIGERVILRAHSSVGLVIAQWATFASDDYCPCSGTAASECRVDVTADIAAHFKRVYCGATWTASRTTVLAH